MGNHITVVFKDLTTEELSEIMREDGKWCAISRSNALEEKEMLENFVRQVADCDFSRPDVAAEELMREMGWA